MDFRPDPVRLMPHPDTPCPVLEAVEVEVMRRPDGALALLYRLQGDLSRVSIPAPQPAGPADGLWQHTCCEAFVGLPGDAAYREFNFSPSGQWAAYGFRGYRERDEAWQPSAAPGIRLARHDGELHLEVRVPADLLPPAQGPWQLGLSAVIETTDGTRSYWALAHPAPRPDFHHRAAFVLQFPPVDEGQGAPD